MSQISGNVVINIALSDSQNRPIYSRQSASTQSTPQQTFPIFGNELVTAQNLRVPVGGVTITLPTGSGATVDITATSLSDNIATYTYTLGTGVALEPGQNITISNCTNSSAFNVTNGVILEVLGSQFTLAITSADIGHATEYVATAITSGVSMVYLRNVGNGTVNVTWTPSGGISETVLPLPAGAEIMMTFPNGNSGITALSFSADLLLSAEVTNVSLTSNIATLTTSYAHGFSVGQLVTTTGITNNSNAFNVVGQVITAVYGNTFSFVLIHADVGSAVATGATPEAVVAAALTDDANQPQMEYAILA